MNKEELISYGKRVEEISWFEDGRDIDGAPYTNGKTASDFLDQVWLFLGKGSRRDGMKIVAAMIEKRKEEGEELADSYCGNWHLWTVLNELGLSRVQK